MSCPRSVIFKKPRAGKRDLIISEEHYEAILKKGPNAQWHDLINFAWHTGARAAEILKIESRHLDLPHHRIVFPVAEEKMRRVPRVIYLNVEAEEIITRLVAQVPNGRLFRNTDGVPWTTAAINCAFERLRKKLGIKYCLTVFRHTWCHRILKRGVDSVTVGQLMGHSDPTMVAKVYSHLSHAPEYLLGTVRKVG